MKLASISLRGRNGGRVVRDNSSKAPVLAVRAIFAKSCLPLRQNDLQKNSTCKNGKKQTLSDTHDEIAPLSDQDFAILDTLSVILQH